MISIVENKDFIVTKIVDIVRNNPKISQKDIVSLVTDIFDSVSEDDTKLILQLLNTLVQNKVIKRVNKGRKVTYSFNDFTDETDENINEENSENEEKINAKKIKQDVNEFILKSLEKNSINKQNLIENTLKELNINEDDKLDTSTESKYTLYKGIIGTVIAELTKSNKISVSGNKNKQVIALVKVEKIKKERIVKEEKKNTKSVKKEVKENSKIKKFKDVMESYDNQISNTLDAMKIEQVRIQKEFNERQKENILRFICNSKEAHDSSISETIASHVICRLYGIELNNAKVQGGPDDGGIDAIVTVKDPTGFPGKRVAIQMKCYDRPEKGCTPTEIKTFLGAMTLKDFRKGFMITTGVFDKNAVKKNFTNEKGTSVHVAKYQGLEFDFGNHERMIICIDGKTLVDYMVEFRLGVLVSDEGNIVGIDREYFNKMSEK